MLYVHFKIDLLKEIPLFTKQKGCRLCVGSFHTDTDLRLLRAHIFCSRLSSCIERGSSPYKSRFLSNQFYLSETLETWSVSRNR